MNQAHMDPAELARNLVNAIDQARSKMAQINMELGMLAEAIQEEVHFPDDKREVTANVRQNLGSLLSVDSKPGSKDQVGSIYQAMDKVHRMLLFVAGPERLSPKPPESEPEPELGPELELPEGVDVEAAKKEAELITLQQELQEAKDNEEYERAQELVGRIRALQG